MRKDPSVISWIIQCGSADSCQRITELLSKETRPDYFLEESRGAFPVTAPERRRLGDYFSQVHLLPAVDRGSHALRLVFHRLPNAGRPWKDMMVRILQSARNVIQDTSIALESRDEEERIQPA